MTRTMPFGAEPKVYRIRLPAHAGGLSLLPDLRISLVQDDGWGLQMRLSAATAMSLARDLVQLAGKQVAP